MTELAIYVTFYLCAVCFISVCVSLSVCCDCGEQDRALSHVVRLQHVCMNLCLGNLSVSEWMDLGRVFLVHVCVSSSAALM